MCIFLKNCSVTFFLFSANESPLYPLSTVETPFCLNRSKLVKMTEIRSKMTYFSLISDFLQIFSVIFLLIPGNE